MTQKQAASARKPRPATSIAFKPTKRIAAAMRAEFNAFRKG